MEPKFQTSFIPKKPLVSNTNNAIERVYQTDIFSVLTSVIFIITLLFSGGLYFYANILTDQISQANADINTAREALQLDKIKVLIDIDSQVKASKGLIERHVIVSKILTLLQTLTLRNVRLDKLTYVNNGTPSMHILGESQGYNALIRQEDVFSKNEFLGNPIFSNFALVEGGKVSFDFNASIVPDLISYKKSIESMLVVENQSVVPDNLATTTNNQ